MTAAVPSYGVVHDAPWLSVCFHEAGHAVVDVVMGNAVAYVQAEGSGGGCTVLREPYPEHPTPEEVREHQIASAAGGAAEDRALILYAHQGDSEADRRWHSAVSGDYAMVEERNHYPGAIGWERAYVEAERLVEEHWDRIEAAAFALSESGRISGTEV